MISRFKIRATKMAKKLLHKWGYVLMRREDLERLMRQHVNSFYESMKSPANARRYRDAGVGIIFSKDRPIQLSALLSSYYCNVKNPCNLHVLYSASSVVYEKEYDLLKMQNSDKRVRFHKETNFRNNLINLLETVDEGRVFFLVDDMVFTRVVDMNEFLDVDLEAYVPTLRLGKNLTRCYTADVKQEKPRLETFDAGKVSGKRFKWIWRDGVYDWGYPLSVDGNLFKTREALAMAKIAVYSAPNSFEKSLQWFMPAFAQKHGVCFERSVVVNIPFNKVQTENDNFSGDVSQEKLLAYWQQGYEIDVAKYYGIDNISAHQELPLYLVKRNGAN